MNDGLSLNLNHPYSCIQAVYYIHTFGHGNKKFQCVGWHGKSNKEAKLRHAYAVPKYATVCTWVHQMLKMTTKIVFEIRNLE